MLDLRRHRLLVGKALERSDLRFQEHRLHLGEDVRGVGRFGGIRSVICASGGIIRRCCRRCGGRCIGGGIGSGPFGIGYGQLLLLQVLLLLLLELQLLLLLLLLEPRQRPQVLCQLDVFLHIMGVLAILFFQLLPALVNTGDFLIGEGGLV